jgi:hypothetical protein
VQSGISVMPTVWNTHLERQTFDHLVNTAIMLIETELSDASSSIGNDMDWLFDTVLDLLFDDSDDNDNSTIGAAIKQVVEKEFRFRKHDLQTVVHYFWSHCFLVQDHVNNLNFSGDGKPIPGFFEANEDYENACRTI